MADTTKRAEYQPPVVMDFGSIEDITQGQINIDLDDFPVGAKTVASGPIPVPTLPPIPSP